MSDSDVNDVSIGIEILERIASEGNGNTWVMMKEAQALLDHIRALDAARAEAERQRDEALERATKANKALVDVSDEIALAKRKIDNVDWHVAVNLKGETPDASVMRSYVDAGMEAVRAISIILDKHVTPPSPAQPTPAPRGEGVSGEAEKPVIVEYDGHVHWLFVSWPATQDDGARLVNWQRQYDEWYDAGYNDVKHIPMGHGMLLIELRRPSKGGAS